MAKKPRAGGVILMAVILGLLTAYLIWRYMQKVEEGNQRNFLPVVVAAVDIKPRTKITRDMVRLENYPKNLIAENALTDVKDAVDRVTQGAINTKEQVRKSHFVPEGQNFTLSLKVPDGMRAIAIGADEIKSVGTSVQPGDHVDIIASYHDPRTGQDLTKMVLQNILVLAINKGDTDASGKQGAQSSMTLAVKPEQTELIAAADRAGTLRVSLRSVRDTTIIPTGGFGAKDLSGAEQPETPTTPIETNEARQTPVIFIAPQSGQRQQRDKEIKILRGTADEKTVIVNTGNTQN